MSVAIIADNDNQIIYSPASDSKNIENPETGIRLIADGNNEKDNIVAVRNYAGFFKVRVINAARRLEKEWRIGNRSANSAFPALADIDGDNKDEIFFTTTHKISAKTAGYIKTIYSYKEDGRLLFEMIMPPSSDSLRAFMMRDPLITVDLNDDGAKEIIYRHENAFYIIGKDGKDISPSWPIELETGYPIVVGDTDYMAVGNFDYDDDLEIVIAQNEGYKHDAHDGHINIHVFNIDGTYVPGWPVTIENCYCVNSIRCGDINGDGYDEVVVVTTGKNADKIENKTIYCLGHDWTELFKRTDIYVTDSILADLNNDGSCELIVGSDKGIDVICKDGESLKGWPFLSNNQAMIPHLAVDIDGDGKIEIIAEVSNNKHALVLGHDGQEKKINYINKVMLPPYKTSMHYADMNGDGLGELIIERRPAGIVSIYKTKASFDPELAHWATPHHDKNNTNRWAKILPKEDTISIEINNASWAVNCVRLGEERNNLNSFGLPAHMLKNAGNVPVRIGVRYHSTAADTQILPGAKQAKDRFVTTVNGAVVPERGEAILSDAIEPCVSLPLYLTFGVPMELSRQVSGMNVSYEIRAYKSPDEKIAFVLEGR